MSPECRFCGAPLSETFVDLGMSPLSNAFVQPEAADSPETYFPLHVYVCATCLLVQLPEHEDPAAIFSDYAYLSSYSQTWLDHCERYAKRMIDDLSLTGDDLVVEIASNDGHLLRYFRDAGVPIFGIEPAANIARGANESGITTEVMFFGRESARQLVARGIRPRLIAANNVLAHVPDINSFVAGLAILATDDTLVTIEFPHLLRLIEECQFDTIYHEHYSYLSLAVVERIMREHGLIVHDVEPLPTHGGSLRVHVSRQSANAPVADRVDAVRSEEANAGLDRIDGYRSFGDVVVDVKCQVLDFLVGARRAGTRVAAYGAPAKGNTLLNYCGVGPELIEFTVDRNPLKQGCLLPGSRIPVLAPDAVSRARPDYLFILPWNIRDEVMAQMAEVREWGGRFVVPIPALEIL